MAGAGGRPKGRPDNPLNKRNRRQPTAKEKKQQQERSNATKRQNKAATQAKEKEDANKKRPAREFFLALAKNDQNQQPPQAHRLPLPSFGHMYGAILYPPALPLPPPRALHAAPYVTVVDSFIGERSSVGNLPGGRKRKIALRTCMKCLAKGGSRWPHLNTCPGAQARGRCIYF